jgi:hypothetical protein
MQMQKAAAVSGNTPEFEESPDRNYTRGNDIESGNSPSNKESSNLNHDIFHSFGGGSGVTGTLSFKH